MLLPSVIFGIITIITDYEPELLNIKVPAFFIDEITGKTRLYGIIKNNILNEIIGVLIIISAFMVAFSKEKTEDEYISKIRLDSLVWSIYFNYAVLLFAFLLIYELSFSWVMIFNMFTVLFFFIIRFHWKIYKLKTTGNHEK